MKAKNSPMEEPKSEREKRLSSQEQCVVCMYGLFGHMWRDLRLNNQLNIILNQKRRRRKKKGKFK